MSTPDTTTEAFADIRPTSADDLPDYAPIPRRTFGPALNEQGYSVGRVERNLYWVTDGTYQSAFLTPPTASSSSTPRPRSVTTSSGPSTRSLPRTA